MSSAVQYFHISLTFTVVAMLGHMQGFDNIQHAGMAAAVALFLAGLAMTALEARRNARR